MANLTEIIKEIEDTSNHDRVHKVASVSALATAGLVEGQAVKLIGYRDGTNVGGGSGVVATARHNGGTAISLTRVFPTDWTNQAQLADWFADSGVDELCFVRTDILILVEMFGLAKGANQDTLTQFQERFTARNNPSAIYPGLVGINNPLDGSVFDFASFGGQGIVGFNPIGFVFHHYANSRMIQMDNVGANNEILYLKNANNPVRRADQPTDFIGSGKFLSLNRQESDGSGGVTGTLEGFYISKDFELVWTQQTSGTETARLWNNIGSFSAFWAHELKNSHKQQYLWRIDNDGDTPISVEWNDAANSTIINTSDSLSIRPLGDLILNPQGSIVRGQKPIKAGLYARADLPVLTAAETGATSYLFDGSDKYPVHWDGSSWKKVSDNTPA